MYEQILIPYDGSNEARKGATHGLELAAALGSSVHGLYVIDLPSAPRSLSLREDEEALREEYEEHAEEMLEELTEMAAEHGVECTTATRAGSVSKEVVDYADEEELDAIVMGSAYRGRVGTLLGGTTDKVVRTARVPVITQRMLMEET